MTRRYRRYNSPMGDGPLIVLIVGLLMFLLWALFRT